jgi:hypothetical protein
MTEPKGPTRTGGENGDGWVSGDRWSPRRVPGIHDVPDATYRDGPRRIERRTLAIAGAIVLGSLIISGGFVVAAGSKGDSGDDTQLSAAATLTSTSTRPFTPSTTAAGTLPNTGSSGSSAPNGSSTGSATTATSPTTRPPARVAAPVSAPPVAAAGVPSAPATPRATANPGFAPYQGKPVPAGVRASLGSCAWVTSGGGTLLAGGNLHSVASGARTWTVTMVWLQNGREFARQNGLVTLAPGELKSWQLTKPQPAPPADIACALEVS